MVKESRRVAEDSAVDVETESRGCEACPLTAFTGLARDAEVALRDVLPSEFWQHRRAAHREVLLALRTLLDAAIERVDKEPAARTRRRPAKISIK